jgi:secreted trypsin-like serine protease
MSLRLAIGGLCAATLIVNAAAADPPSSAKPKDGKPAASFARPGADGARKKIVGGVLAPEKPWQVSLFSGDTPLGADASTGHFCGGVLIRAQWVLTAAHCVDGKAKGSFRIFAGSASLSEGGVIYAVSEVDIHPGFSRGTMTNDLALVRLAPSVQARSLTASRIASIDVMSAAAEAIHVHPGLTKATVYGWGVQASDSIEVPPKLWMVQLPVASQSDCQTSFQGVTAGDGAPLTIGAGMICAGGVAGKDACLDDSGGPLVVSYPDPDGLDADVLLGVVSFGRDCGVAGEYGVYTRVSAYSDWLAKTMGADP